MNSIRTTAIKTTILSAIFTQAAFAEKPVLGPADLYNAHGSTAAYAGGGTALTTDLSAVDSNPAGLTLGKAAPGYFVATETHWTNRNLHTFELGILDNASSEIAAGLKVRRSAQVTGAKVDRLSVGLSEQVGTIPLFFGLAGDLDIFEKPQIQAQKERNYRIRSGLLLQVVPSFFIGARTGGWLDRSEGATQTHAVGVSWSFSNLGAIAADAEFIKDSVSAYIGSAVITPWEWLDVQAGYGYEVEALRHRVSGSVAFHSEKFRLSYSVAKPSDTSLPLSQFVGFSFNVLAADKD